MTGTFKTKTRFYTSEKFLTPISGRKSFIESAVDFRRSLIENSAMSVLNADIAVKAAMGAGLSTPSVGQGAQGDADGKKRVNKGGVPGMEETEDGYRYIPDATWGPGKTLKLFPSRENRQSSNKVPNFGFVDQEPIVTPEQYVQQMENKPKIRMSKYKVNSRTGEPIEDTEVEFDRMRFGKTFDINPDASDEIRESESEEIREKSLGRTLKQRMPGGSLVGRAAARFGVIMDELGKMRCPPGTPAANQFTDMTGSNCFGTSPGTLISEAINLAQRLVPDDDPRRSSGATRRIVNMMFDLDNGIFGNNVWYNADGTRMKHGEWRKFREAGGVAKNERWMVNGVDRTLSELDSQDARMEDLYRRLGVDTDDARKATNEDVFDAFQKLRDSGVIRARLDGRPTPAQVEAMMTSRLKNMDAHWIARTDAEKKTLLDIEVKRYRELERAHIEAFLDEVIKNPEHMKTIGRVTFNPTGKDRASFGIDGLDPNKNPIGSINIDIPTSMEFQDSMLPNLSPDERLRIWAEGGTSDTLRAMAVKDFLVNSNSHAGEMMAMVDGGRGLGRHDMKHEIAHSIQAVAIFNHMKRELDARGSLIINRGKDKKGNPRPPLTITDVSQLDSDMLMALMSNENFAGIDLDALKNLRSRADVVAFLGGRYIDQFPPGKSQRAMEIGAELWALRSAGLIYGDDVDAALEYMDDVASGKITIDRTVSDSMLTRRVYEEHLDGSRRIREAREARERDREYAEAALSESDRLAEEAADGAEDADGFFDAGERDAAARTSAAREAYAAEKRAEVKATKEKAKTMTEDEMVDFLTDSTEASDMLSEMLDAIEESGEEADWMAVMDRDALDVMSKSVVDEWVKRFTVRRSPEAMEKLQKMIDDKRESRGTLSSEKIEERQFRNFKEGAEERSKEMELDDLVQSYSDWDEMASGEGVEGADRARRKEMRDMYREEYIKRRTEGPDSISREDARKEFNSKFKTMRKPKTTAAREREKRANPKKFKTHNGKDGARTFATQERERLLEGATTAEKVAFVEMGSGDTDVINMMSGTEEGMAAARAIQRRNTRLRKNGVLPDELNHHEASIEQQVENFYIPLIELMDKSSLSQTVEMHIDSNDDAAKYVTDLLNGNPPEFTVAIGTGTLVTDKTDFSDGKKIIIRVPEGSRALFPDWSFYSESDNGEQKMMIPPSKFHLVEVRDDGTVVLEVGEQRGTEEILKDAVNEIGPGDGGAGDVAYRQGLQKKVDRVVEKRIAERRAQGIFDPEKRSPVEEERFSASADNSAAAAGFTPDAPPRPPTPPPTKPTPKRGVDRKKPTTAILRVLEADRDRRSAAALAELQDVHAFITGEGAFQNRTNQAGSSVGMIMQREFGTRNIAELTEEQKYDLIDLISEKMNKGPSREQRGLSFARSKIQDHIDISKMLDSNDFSNPYPEQFISYDYVPRAREQLLGSDDSKFSSGAKWGSLPSNNQQISNLLDSANNDGFNEIYGPPQTREERIAQMAEMQSEVLSSLREIADNIPGSGDELGFSASNIDPVILDLVKNSSDEEIYEIISKAAMDLHQSFDARPRVRMREDELEKFIETQRYGRESSFDSGPTTFSSGLVGRGIRARAKERAVEMIAERIGKDEDSREIAEIVLNTASALKFGPEAALARLAIDLGRRGSRDIAERTLRELVERGKLTDEQAKSILSKVDKVAPEGLPDPLKRGVGRAARAAADALDTPENRERLDNARQAAGDAAGRAREAVGEGARNLTERGRERLRRLRERDDRGELPSSPEDVAFGDFDPADSTFSSGRRLDRRVSNSDVGRERIMDGAKKTRTRFSSGATPEKKEPKKPSRPREPDNGPMTGKFIDIFRGVKSYKEMLDRYNEQEVIFFDYETTGFDPKVEKPVQLGAVKMKGGKVIERFNIFSNPEKELSDWSKANLVDAEGNPLTNEWLSGQPSIAEAHKQMIDFFGPDALLGGQYTPFDLGFLEESLKNAGIEWKPAGVIDSKALADELLPKWTPETGDGPFALNDDGTKFATNSLGPLSEYLGVQLDAWHSADADSEASAMIVQKILERAAVREDTPKHLINVENLPAVVAERRAKHKLAMDKYFADMKTYKAEMEAYNASQRKETPSSGERFSSGATPNAQKIFAGRSQSGIPEKAKETLQKNIDEKRAQIDDMEELNRRLRLAMEELQATGSWQGEKYDIRINDQGIKPPVTATKEELEAQAVRNGVTLDEEIADYVQDIESAGRDRRANIDSIEKEVKKLEDTKDFITKNRQDNAFHIEELLTDPAIAEELRRRSSEVNALPYREREQRFTDPNDPDAVYVLHWGATEFQGGVLDPSRSRGQLGAGIQGNTRQINDETARAMVGKRNSAKRDMSILEDMKRQAENNNGVIDFNEIAKTDPKDTLRAGRARLLFGVSRRDGDVPTANADAYRISQIDSQIGSEKRVIDRLDKIADQLIADDYQYSSTYRASGLQDLFSSYGGRYSEEGTDEWGNSVGKSSSTGIHIFRVKIGEDATEENSVGETHLVGKHTPIASLVADNDPDPKNPASDTWAGWVDMAIQADIAERAKSSSPLSGEERFSSGATYKKLVREKGRPSEKQREAISDVRDLFKDDELKILDDWTFEDGVVDSPKRAEFKSRVAKKLTEAFSHDLEAKEDVVVTAKNGEKINLGKEFEVSISEVEINVDNYDKDTLKQIKEEELYDVLAGQNSDSPSTLITMKIQIKPKDKEALDRLEKAGIPSSMLPDYFEGKPGAADVSIGRSSRQLAVNGDEMHAVHESLIINEEAQGKGLGSLFNAKNEGVYEELGVQRIITNGQSSELSEMEGGTHWPRNGFTWAGEKSKQDFIKVIDRAIRREKRKFSEEELKKIGSLYRKNPETGKFETDASPEELIDFEYADELFKSKDTSFMFKREIEQLDSAGRFSSGATGGSSAKPASAEGPRANKPKRVKKYKGYELKEPDNPEPKPGEFPDDIVEAAKKHREKIEKVEAEITKLLIDLAEKNNARMEGLDFRLKALKSLMRKIASEKDSEHGGDAKKAAEAMSDVVRYTMSYGEEDYVAGVKDVVEQMQKLGYDLRIKNYWQSDDPYQGINVAVTHPDGTKFELQFHTPQSVLEKEKIHLMYEDYRGSTDPKQRWELYQKMVEIANKIGVPVPPEELLSIGEIKVQPFS